MSTALRVLDLKLTPAAARHIADSRMVRRFFQCLYNSDRKREAERTVSSLCGFTATIRSDGSVTLQSNGEAFPASTQQMMNCRSWMIENGETA